MGVSLSLPNDKSPGSATIQHFRGFLLWRYMFFDTFPSIDSICFFRVWVRLANLCFCAISLLQIFAYITAEGYRTRKQRIGIRNRTDIKILIITAVTDQ